MINDDLYILPKQVQALDARCAVKQRVPYAHSMGSSPPGHTCDRQQACWLRQVPDIQLLASCLNYQN